MAKRRGQFFRCSDCLYAEYLSIDQIIDEDGIFVSTPTGICEYCENEVCENCQEKHEVTDCGNKRDAWEAKQLSQMED